MSLEDESLAPSENPHLILFSEKSIVIDTLIITILVVRVRG
jgi:hypothetical protein